MEKVIYDEKNGLWYELQGDYYIPCLKLPEEEQQPIGVWGQRHLRYIREDKKVFYTNLLTSGKLQSHLADVEEQAQELFDRLMKNSLSDFPCNKHVTLECIMNKQRSCLIQPVKQTAAIEIPVHSEVKFFYQMCSD